jgi:hypothetical protein
VVDVHVHEPADGHRARVPIPAGDRIVDEEADLVDHAGVRYPVQPQPEHRRPAEVQLAEVAAAGLHHDPETGHADPDVDPDLLTVGAENSVRSCDLHILVYEATEPVSSQRPKNRCGWRGSVGGGRVLTK